MNDGLKDFPIPKYNITVDLEVFTDPAGDVKVEIIPKEEDIEKFGEMAIISEAELILSEIMNYTRPPNKRRKG